LQGDVLVSGTDLLDLSGYDVLRESLGKLVDWLDLVKFLVHLCLHKHVIQQIEEGSCLLWLLDLQRVNQALLKEKLDEEERGLDLNVRAQIQLDADVSNQLLSLILDGLNIQVYQG